jgi:hypothetical protein
MQQTIPSLPRAVADYVRAFDLTAICAYRDGRVGVSRNPVGAAAAWWVEAEQAGAVIRLARKDGSDIQVVARRLGVAVTEHAIVLKRASAAIERIEAALREAQRRGDLKFFNSEYKRRRGAAVAAGQTLMSYGEARARLHKAVASAAASGGTMTRTLIESVFGKMP